MKTTSWKYIVAACSACLLLFTALANAGLLTFDTLGSSESPIPNGYGNLQWDNMYTLDAVTYDTPSGYQVDMVSRSNVAFNASGEPASIFVNSGSFKPVMAFVTAAWDNGLQLQVKGYLKGKLVRNHTFTLSTMRKSVITFGNVRVDELDFSTNWGSQFSMDNFPGSIAQLL